MLWKKGPQSKAPETGTVNKYNKEKKDGIKINKIIKLEAKAFLN